jgi:hypothetical protein
LQTGLRLKIRISWRSALSTFSSTVFKCLRIASIREQNPEGRFGDRARSRPLINQGLRKLSQNFASRT